MEAVWRHNNAHPEIIYMATKAKTFIERLHEPIVPELQAVIDYRASIQADRDKISSLTFYLEDLKKAEGAARVDVYQEPRVEAFAKWVSTRQAVKAAEDNYNELMQSVGHFHQRLTKSPDAADVLLPAIKLIRDRLAKEIARLNDEEAKRLQAEGLEPTGENPAITQHRAYLSELASAIVEIPNHTEALSVSVWDKYNPLIKV
jgi:hypothetical protein